MEANERREPTLAEIMEEIRKSKDDVIMNMEVYSLTTWFTPLAIGLSICLFGIGALTSALVSGWGSWWLDAIVIAWGVGLMLYATIGRRRVEKKLWDKWCKTPRKS